MKQIIKIGKVFSKKDGTPYIILSVLDTSISSRYPYSSLEEVLAHPEENKEVVFVGQNVDEYLIAEDDLKNGKVEIDGKIILGKEVRVFLEGTPARVTYIKVAK